MKSVLISIHPKWCGLIASGKKTIEVRKTAPKLPTPFKCYIYCTQDKRLSFWKSKTYAYADDRSHNMFDIRGNGKVIGEFMCYATMPISVKYSDPSHRLAQRDFPFTGMTDKQIIDYLGNGKMGYGWHILDLKIYDNPRELSEFRVEDKPAIKACKHRFRAGQPEYVARHGGWLQGGWGCMKTREPEWCENCLTKPLTRPPQSWCYVDAE